MKSVLGLVAFALSLTSSTLALHASEAGVIDWHKQFIGVPSPGSVAPVFHHFNTTEASASEISRSLILTGTASNVLAALDPVTGEVGE